MRSRLRCLSATFIVIAVGYHMATATANDRNSAINIDSIPDSNKLGFVLAALDEREKILSNCRFQLVETDTNIERASGARTPKGIDECEFRRSGNVEWIHFTYHSTKPPHPILAVSDFSWDRAVSRGIGYPPYVSTSPDPACRIDGTISPSFVNMRYLEILGFHVQAKFGTLVLPLPSLIRQVATDGGAVVVKTDALDGRTAVRLDLDIGPSEHAIFWLDPAKGLMPIGRDLSVRHNDAAPTRVTHRVIESQRINGTWVPTQTMRVDDLPLYPATSESVFKVDHFEIGTTRNEDVRVLFPAGAHVIDAVQRIGYIVRPNGKYELIRVASTSDQKVYDPPAQKIVSDPSTAGKLYTSGPLLTGTEPIYAARTGRWKRTVAVLALLGLVAIVGWLHHRQRGTLNAKP